MDKELRQIIEEFNSLVEDELVDDFDGIEISDQHLDAPAEDNTTDKLDAKTKISRALDVLKQAIEDFKNSTLEEMDLVSDADLSVSFDSLDEVTNNITNILNGNGNQEEAPVEDIEVESTELEEVPEDEKDDEEDLEEVNFDTEAELDLFNPEGNSDEE